jgi:O-antigen/teichoic acid export membrane protein
MAQRLLKDSFLYGISDFISKGIAALFFPVFTSYLSVSDFGVLALITVISSLIGMFAEFGINNAIQLFYFDTKFMNNQRSLVTTGLLLQTILSAFLVFITILLILPIKDLLLFRFHIRYEWILLCLLIIVPNSMIRYILNILRLHHKPVLFGIVSLLINLLWMFPAIYLIKNYGMGIGGYFIANLIMLLIITPVAILSIKKDIGIKTSILIGKEVLKLGYPFIFSNIAYWLFGSVDRWLLAEYSDTIQVGLYSIAYKIAIVVVMVNSAFSQAWSPVLLEIINRDIKEGILYIKRVSIYYLRGLSLVCIGVSLFAKEVLVLMTPKEYWPASLSVGIIAFAIFINGTTQFTLVGISFTRNTKFINYSSWIAVLLNIPINIILSRYFGALGASIAMVITYAILSACYNYYSKSVFEYSLSFTTILVPSLSILFVNLLMVLLDDIEFSWTYLLIKTGIMVLLLIYYFKKYKIKEMLIFTK